MPFKNYMEDIVIDVFEEFKRRYPHYCFCHRCTEDIIALALTQLKGKYAVTPQGEVFAKMAQEDRQVRADVLLVLMEAAETVSKAPKH